MMAFEIAKFTWVSYIGSGSFGHVHRYTSINHEGDVTDVAVKRLTISADAFDIANCKEIQIIRTLRHQNVVQFLGHCTLKGQISVVMELCKADLQNLIDSQRSPSTKDVAFLTIQVCQGLEYIHAHGIIHRDIKPHNILIQCAQDINLNTLANIRWLVLKITDFGLSKMLDETATSATMTFAGTNLYMAPELRSASGRKVHYSMRSDVYSLGLVAYNLLRRDLHKLAPGNKGIGTSIFEKQLVTPLMFHNFLTVCLQNEPEKRHTSSQLLQHPFINKATRMWNQLLDDMRKSIHKEIASVHFTNPDLLVLGLKDGTNLMYDTMEMSMVATKRMGHAVMSLASNDDVIAASDVKGNVLVWDKNTFDVAHKIRGDGRAMWRQNIRLSNRFLVTFGTRNMSVYYTTSQWRKVAEIDMDHLSRCAYLVDDVLTVATSINRLKSFRLTVHGCQELRCVTLNEMPYSIWPGSENRFWVGTWDGFIMSVNMEPCMAVVMPVKRFNGWIVHEVINLQEFLLCTLYRSGKCVLVAYEIEDLLDPLRRKEESVEPLFRQVAGVDHYWGKIEPIGDGRFVFYYGQNLEIFTIEELRCLKKTVSTTKDD